MSKLTRKLKKIFSINSPSDIGVWGSINTTTSTDPDVIQSTGYETGVSAAEVSGKKLLPRKDFNGLKYETDYHLAYLYQSGIPEYNAATTYYVGDIVRGDSTSFIYKSLVDNNVGNALTSASWLLCGDLANGLVNDNIADNGDFIIAQRGTSFTSATTFTNNDGNYTFDRFKVGNSAGTTGVVNVSRFTSPVNFPDGARAAIRLLHQQADKQAYIAQYYDNDTTETLLNKDVSLSFEIYNSASVTKNFRAAILSWQGTADNMPFYPVTTWQTANDLVFATNFTIENTTTALTANATSWNRFTINGVNIDTANTNNLAIVIWTDEEMPNAYEWRATKIKLEQSSIATAWKAKGYTDEYNNCVYFWEKLTLSAKFPTIMIYTPTNDSRGVIYFAKKRATPTISKSQTNMQVIASSDTSELINIEVPFNLNRIDTKTANIKVTNASNFGTTSDIWIFNNSRTINFYIDSDL